MVAEPTVGDIYRRAFKTYFERFGLVAGTAAIVFGPLGFLEGLTSQWAYQFEDEHDTFVGLLVALAVFAGSSALILGSTFYAGYLDRVIGEHQYGDTHQSPREALRTLPYTRLVVASLIVGAVVSIGLALFVVPGLIALTLLAIVGPAINVEGHGVVSALRRSVELTRRFPRQTFVAVTLPVVVESFVSDAIEAALLHDAPLLVAGIIGALIAATAGAIVGLTEVSLAFQLITHDNASQTGTARAARQTPA
ncbi:MAG TPA: hypothetical protein VIH21_07680 [Dehalococcoidia bacterium]